MMRVKEGNHWVHVLHGTLHGTGGIVDGQQATYVDHFETFTQVPFFYFATIKGRVVDPHSN